MTDGWQWSWAVRQAAALVASGPDPRHAGPLPATPARCIAPPTVDGATRLLRTGPVGWLDVDPGLRAVVHRISEGLVTDREGRPLRAVVWSWKLADGRVVPASVSVSGSDRQWITVEVKGAIWLRWHKFNGGAIAQAGARELWWGGAGGKGWLAWLDLWLRSVDRLFGYAADGELTPIGGRVEPAPEAPDGDPWPVVVTGWAPGESWRVTGLEVCADFVGWSWSLADLGAVLGSRRVGSWGVWTVGDGVRAQTISIGKRTTSPVSACFYDKSAEMARGEGAEIYTPVHEAHGWTGERIQRVEFRFRGDGLEFVSSDGEIMSLRDPAAITPKLLRELWGVMAEKKRMIIVGSATRRERCLTDPRWSVVAAAGDRPQTDWRQSREPQENAHAIRLRNAARAALAAALRVATLAGANSTVDPLEVAARVLASWPAADLGSVFARAEDYRREQLSQLGPEIEAARVEWASRIAEAPAAAVIRRASSEISRLDDARAERAELARARRSALSFRDLCAQVSEGRDAGEFIRQAADLIRPLWPDLHRQICDRLEHTVRIDGWPAALEYLDEVRDVVRAIDWPDSGAAAKRWELLATSMHETCRGSPAVM